MQNPVMNQKRSLLLHLFLLWLLLAINNDFLSDITIFYLTQQLNSHICQGGLSLMHHLHYLQSWGLLPQYSQKFSSLSLELSPQNLRNLAFFISTKLIPPWYLMRTKVLTTTVMLLDLQVLLALVPNAGGLGLDTKSWAFHLIKFRRVSLPHFLMPQYSGSWIGSTVDQIWNQLPSSNCSSTMFF